MNYCFSSAFAEIKIYTVLLLILPMDINLRIGEFFLGGGGGINTLKVQEDNVKLTYGMVLVNQRNRHEGHMFVPIPWVPFLNFVVLILKFVNKKNTTFCLPLLKN